MFLGRKLHIHIATKMVFIVTTSLEELRQPEEAKKLVTKLESKNKEKKSTYLELRHLP